MIDRKPLTAEQWRRRHAAIRRRFRCPDEWLKVQDKNRRYYLAHKLECIARAKAYKRRRKLGLTTKDHHAPATT